MQGRILLLSWTVPPETTGSAVIVGNLAKRFTRDEMVVAGERPQGRPPVMWKEDWPEIHYVTKGCPPSRRGARWRRKLQIPAMLRRCLRLIRSHDCTQILAVFPSEEYLLVGYLAARITGASLYPYFHNTYLEQCQPRSLHARMARRLQARVFAEARHVFVMSEGMVELYRERYPELTCSALVHSFNEDIPAYLPPPSPGTPCRFVMSGNINDSCSDAAVRLAAGVRASGGSLTILSGTPKAHLEQLGLLGAGVTYDTVSRDFLLSRMSEHDIVLLAHGFTGGLSPEEYQTIFPTKTIEYLISGRPILAHTPPGCYLTRFLRAQRCALIVDRPELTAIVHAIDRLRTDAELRETLVRNAIRAAQMFSGTAVAAALRSKLEVGPVREKGPFRRSDAEMEVRQGVGTEALQRNRV